MATMLYMPHVNGGDHPTVHCAYCGASLHDERERAAAHSVSGTKFFCKADPENVQESCYLNWRRRQH